MSLTRRRATAADIPRLVEMGEAFAASTRLPVPFDPEGLAEALGLMLGHEGVMMLVVADGDRAVGALGAFASKHMLFRNAFVAFESFFWIEPEYRGKGAQAIRLIEAYEAWARGMGCSAAIFSTFAPDEAMRPFLERRGYVHAETSFSLTLAAA